MNRRNFVVGLGTVATISGVASVTSAAFSAEVSPSTNFQIVPEDRELVVQRLDETLGSDSYSDLADSEPAWNESEITDFGNVTGEQGSSTVAHVNDSENGELGAQLAFNNTNNSGSTQEYTDYTADDENGFFEVVNLGETDERIAIELTPYDDNVGDEDGDVLTEDQVYEMFTFEASDGTQISPTDSGSDPENDVEINSGDFETIGLNITITNEMYDSIQEAAGGAFESTESSIRLLDEITIGTDPDTEN